MWMKVAATATCIAATCYTSYRIFLWSKNSFHRHVGSSARCETSQEGNKHDGHLETRPGNKTGSEEVASLHDDQQGVGVVTIPSEVNQDQEEHSNVVRTVKAAEDVHLSGDSECVPHIITAQDEVNITLEIAAGSNESNTVPDKTFDSAESNTITDNTSSLFESEIVPNNTLSTDESKVIPDITPESNIVPNISEIVELNVTTDNTSYVAESNMAPDTTSCLTESNIAPDMSHSTESKIFPVPDNTLGSNESNIATDNTAPDTTSDSNEFDIVPNNTSGRTESEILPNSTPDSTESKLTKAEGTTESETVQEIFPTSPESNACTEVPALAEDATHAAAELKCTAVENGQHTEDRAEVKHLEMSNNAVSTDMTSSR